MYRPPEHPQSIGRVLDNGFKLYRQNFRRVFLLMLVAGIIVVPITLFEVPDTPVVLNQRGFDFHHSLDFYHTIALWGILAFVIKLLLKGATVHALAASANGGHTTARDNITTALKNLLSLFIAYVCYWIAVVIGLFLLIIPGIWLGYSLVLFAIPLLMENLGPLRSLGKSYETVKGNWWRTVTVLSVIGLIVVAIYFLIITVVGAIFGFDLDEFRMLAHSHALTLQGIWMLAGVILLQIVLNALLQPLAYAVAVAHYQDLRLRKSGDDLDDRIRSALSNP